MGIIQNWKLRREQKKIFRQYGGYLFSDFREDTMTFSRLIFLNICDLLTDLSNDVSWQTSNTLRENVEKFNEFVKFFNDYGKYTLDRLFIKGYVVIGHSEISGFRVLYDNEYITSTNEGYLIAKPVNPMYQIYIMRSETFMLTGQSDYSMLNPFLTFLDNILNSSNTITARLGALIVASPQQTNQPSPEILTPEEKSAMETQTGENYGSLRTQKQFMIFPRPMNLQAIGLSSTDNKMLDKIKTCVLSIADRIKVPANQIALIDALSSKSFANGSEMREGDFAKYQSFERLLNATFVKFANDLDLKVNYTIYNKPVRVDVSVNI